MMNRDCRMAFLVTISIIMTHHYSTAFSAHSVSHPLGSKNDNKQEQQLRQKDLRLYYLDDGKLCYLNAGGKVVIVESSTRDTRIAAGILDECGDEIDDGIILVEKNEALRYHSTSSAPPSTSSSPSSFASSIIKSKAKEQTDILNEQKIKRENQKEKTVYSCRHELWAMCRPSNFVGVLIFHTLGTFLGLRANNIAAAAPAMEQPIKVLLQTLVKPSMMTVLLSIMLISSSSMMVNDYYDSRRVTTSSSGTSNLRDPVPVPPKVVKRCLSYLYATLLVCSALVPGIPARLAVVTGSLLTFWYTQHLKPITWLKNVVCAMIIAISPFTSYAAAVASSRSSGLVVNILRDSKLWALTGTLFCGFVARELLMDIEDTDEDSKHNVLTVPVKYGRRFASRTALVCSLLSTLLAVLAGGTSLRSTCLALAGGGLQTIRIAQMVFFTRDCENDVLLKNIINQGILGLGLLFASFL